MNRIREKDWGDKSLLMLESDFDARTITVKMYDDDTEYTFGPYATMGRMFKDIEYMRSGRYKKRDFNISGVTTGRFSSVEPNESAKPRSKNGDV